MQKPLVSFAVGCYNQEDFIREAFESALAQDYSPLEIIISDDCSKDRTFEIASEIAAAYRGPHDVKLNRNPKNLGLGGNYNRLMELCHGELVVLAAGDDISLPNRTTINVEAWNDSGRKATSIYSRVSLIDESGNPIGDPTGPSEHGRHPRFAHQRVTIPEFARRRKPSVPGCAHAVAIKLRSLFGAIPSSVVYEDTALAFRTVLAGGVFTSIDSPLVKYRRHGANVTFGLHQVHPRSADSFADFQKKRLCEWDRFVQLYKCFLTDSEVALQQGLIPAKEYPAMRKHILAEARRMQLKRDLLVKPWLRRFLMFCELYWNTIRPREMLEWMPYLLPRNVYCAGVVAKNRIWHKDPALIRLQVQKTEKSACGGLQQG